MQTLWQKDAAPVDWLLRFTVGEDYRWDTLLLPYDIEGTRAHARALGRLGLLDAEEVRAVSDALDALRAEVEAGRVTVRVEDEDAHTVIERWLTERLGPSGQKIHAGRSRNDQVLVALRLWLRDALRTVGRLAEGLALDLVALGRAHADVLLPGHTHLQRAMPSTAELWALGFAELLADDLATLGHAARLANASPWGSAAGYGVPHLDLPREEVARELGFDTVQTHVTAVQLSRGKLEAAVAHALVQIGLTANRLASDLVLFASAEFGFVELPPEATTGSSIMPQKRNPDVFELARAAVHRLTAELYLLLTLPANLPSGYHRDLQLTKEAVLRATRTTTDVLAALRHALPGVRFRAERTRAAVTPELFATDEALRRVTREGVPFREAYRAVAAALDALEPPTDPLGAYRTPGTPGRSDPEHVRRRLAEAAAWTRA